MQTNFKTVFVFISCAVSFGRRVEEDPEPWRCKRTDGKKWRCSREASGDSKYCERHKHRGKKCLNRSAEMPLFNTFPSSSSLMSSYAPPPPALYSHPVESKLSPLLGEATGLCLETPCHARIDMRTIVEEKQETCYVFGADLKLQKPVNVATESKEAKSPKLQLNLFDGERSESWMNSKEVCTTQLSMSISRC